MKGIILAGGNGTRLHPLTQIVSKPLLPVGKYPMIYYSIYKLKQANINDILIVTNQVNAGEIIRILGNGNKFGVKLTYKVQEEQRGISHAILLAGDFVKDDKSLVILSDNIFSDRLTSYVNEFRRQKSGAKIILKQVKEPNRFGIATIKNAKIISIEEKPEKPKSNYAITGIYMFDQHVFELIRTTKVSIRGEYEVSDVNNIYLGKDQLSFNFLHGWWVDAGTHDSLQEANSLVKTFEDISLSFY